MISYPERAGVGEVAEAVLNVGQNLHSSLGLQGLQQLIQQLLLKLQALPRGHRHNKREHRLPGGGFFANERYPDLSLETKE
jgi:hypothetical protein